MKIQWVVKLSKSLSGRHTGGTELQALRSRSVKKSYCTCTVYVWFPKEVTLLQVKDNIPLQFKFCALLCLLPVETAEISNTVQEFVLSRTQTTSR